MSTLHMRHMGQGFPVVLLHGFCETHMIWSDMAVALSADYSVWMPDLPGFGESKNLPDGFSIEDVAEKVYADLKEKGLEEFAVIGHSLGGYVALAMAAKHPEAIRLLGLFNSTAYADTEEKRHTRNKTIEFVQNRGVQRFIDTFVPNLFYGPRREELADAIEEINLIARRTSKDSLVNYTKAMRDRPERLDLLENFDKPVLFIAGEEDSFTTQEDIHRQAQLLLKPYVQVLPQTAHMAMYERFTETSEFIKGALMEVVG
ncbi:alpha/beta fold hydrolase [Roseivirga sp. BDSF3-8]|uniref:alpha/beta fold hydrolase n=1 Tax=Roseivirga sp. BDSF3-8 TaxID=3241598 RepID=UPI0035324284